MSGGITDKGLANRLQGSTLFVDMRGRGGNNRVNTLNEWPNGPSPADGWLLISCYLYISSTQTAESTQSTFSNLDNSSRSILKQAP